ncbi:MAG: hypothetical protein ACTSR8_00620 [Promethearchaeota archaeon]
MSISNLKTLFENYLYANSKFEKISIANMVIEEVFKKGFDITALEYFSHQFDEKLKRELVSEIFLELSHADKAYKLQIIDTLSSFLIETTLLIQDQIIPIYIKNLSNRKDFKLVFATLKVFTSKWNEFNDKLKKKLFHEFLIILDNPFDIFIEEGIYEITKIILNSKSSLDYHQDLFSKAEKQNFLKKLINISAKSKGDSLYAGLESIKEIIQKYPDMANSEYYHDLASLFKKILKKKTLFYPAKREYIKISLSFLELMYLFEKSFYNEAYIENFKALLEKMALKIDHADVKYLLDFVLHILKTSENFSKIEVIKAILEILRNLYQKKDRLEEYTARLLEEIITIAWPLMSDEDKDKFFVEIDKDNSVI